MEVEPELDGHGPDCEDAPGGEEREALRAEDGMRRGECEAEVGCCASAEAPAARLGRERVRGVRAFQRRNGTSAE